VRKLVAGALLLALSGAPALVQAETKRQPPMGEVQGRSPAQPGPVSHSPNEARDYAAREAAAPELAEFIGGGSGIYIGGSTLVIVLLVVLIVILI
jgi:hypothetical protein